MKRILDIRPREFSTYSKPDILASIKAAEGRTLLSEVIAPAPALFHDVSNVELAAAFGADMMLINMYDVNAPSIDAYAYQGDHLLKDVQNTVGRFVGINLEPVSEDPLMDEKRVISEGRKASLTTVQKALDQGAQYVLLTGNPKTGVTNKEIVRAIKEIAATLGEKIIIMAGKMHSSGIASETATEMLNQTHIKAFIDAGADVILIPAPGTVPGFSESYAQTLVDYIHSHGKLAMSAIGTSQEGADSDTIRLIALACKRIGVDIHHIGDAGFMGIATPENILQYSKTIRGIRHTYRRMAMR